jgi:hypothetical protein
VGEASLTGGRGHSWDAGRRVASVSEELSNAASEWLRFVMAYCNKNGAPSDELTRASLTDDYVYEDRRHHGLSFPNQDAESTPKAVTSLWDTGGGEPRFTMHEILAVRGDRIAACRVSADYPNGWTTESIEVLELDASLSLLRRMFDFDHDDVDAAIAELDRLHSQSDAI